MRTSRSIQLHPNQGFVHKIWRCANKQFLLSHDKIKDLYMHCTHVGLNHKSTDNNSKLHSYCIMNNHVHMLMSYENSSVHLSNFMRISHSKFGSYLNKQFNRTGKVANERPKTPLIENAEHCMRVHFYIEANPIRANLVKFEKLKFYKYSSYKFFAYGLKDKWTKLLTLPFWYLELGDTADKCQKEYRRLFKQYLYDSMASSKWAYVRYIGSIKWQESMLNSCKTLVKQKNVTKTLSITTDSS